MLKFVQNWLGPRANPIGIDLGTDTIRMAQVQQYANQPVLLAAASAALPLDFRGRPSARVDCIARTVSQLLSQGQFRGRSGVLALPASITLTHRIAVHSETAEEIKSEIEREARERFELGSDRMLLRHVLIETGPENTRQALLFSARRSDVEQLLTALADAGVDVIGMNLEPLAQIDCIGQVYRRASDLEATVGLIDIGAAGTRFTITRERKLLYTKSLPIGGDQICAALAKARGTNQNEARLLRLKLAHSEATEPTAALSVTNLGDFSPAAIAAASDIEARREAVNKCCESVTNELIAQLASARKEYELTDGGRRIDRLLFIGGEARDRRLCQEVARKLQLAAQIGDPLLQMRRTSELSAQSGIDRRQPQPAWTVAIGLSMGPAMESQQPPVRAARNALHRSVCEN